MSDKHTPGPWTLGHVGQHGAFEIGVNYRHGLPSFVVAGRNDVSHRSAESAANARLIAAAPDMLAALREVAHHADEECGFMMLVKAAIARAEGTGGDSPA